MQVKTIDVHTHLLPPNVLKFLLANEEKFGISFVKENGAVKKVVHKQGHGYPLSPQMTDPSAKLEDMDKQGIDVACISITPTTMYYWESAEKGAEISKAINDGIADVVAKHPNRFTGMGTLPLQDVDASLKELERVVKELGMKAIQLGTNVENESLDEGKFLPVFQLAEQLGVFILFHPYYIGTNPLMPRYYLTNLVGNPLNTTTCAANLIFSGLYEKCPNLKTCFAHGGGFIPYQRGRLEHGFKVRQEAKVAISKPPSEYIKKMYFDTITHWPQALKFLVDTCGSDHVVLGTDHPFDMADSDPVGTVKAAGLSPEDEARILGGNMMKLLGL